MRRHLSPIEPKTSFYKTNGSGRDIYIHTDSGGFQRGNMLPPMNGLTGSFPKNGSPVRNNKPRFDGKTVFYHSNGTGRDNYIGDNAGGFVHDGAYNKEGFFSTLRSYDKSRSPSNLHGSPDYFVWAQNQKPKVDKKIENTNGRTLRHLLQRLSPSNSPTKHYQRGCSISDLYTNDLTSDVGMSPKHSRKYASGIMTHK